MTLKLVRAMRQSSAALLILVSLAACGESTSPVNPASVGVDPATVAEGTAGVVLATSPTFTVKDADGNALGGVPITITVTAGGGTLTGAPTSTSGGGSTSVGTWKPGNTAGINSVTGPVRRRPPLVISVLGRPGPPASIAFISGATQQGPAGTVVPIPPVAQVRDQFGNGVPGVPVVFTIAEGDGQVSATPVTTDASGNAISPAWTLGKSAAPQSLRASAGTLSATVSALVLSSYAIELRFLGPSIPAVVTEAFNAAGRRISGAVTGDVFNIALPPEGVDLADCGIAGETLTGVIDDIIIYARIQPIDGPSNILASAGACFIRDPGFQTVVGVMQFDTDDLPNLLATPGRLQSVVQHEMLHAVGMGASNWNRNGIILDRGTPDTRYVGANGIAGCVAVGGASICATSVPLHNTDGPGSADSHWRESVFGNELMTAGINAGPNPMSLLTVRSLTDVGYIVNIAAADSYTIPGQAGGAWTEGSATSASARWEKVIQPRFLISRTGRLTPLKPAQLLPPLP